MHRLFAGLALLLVLCPMSGCGGQPYKFAKVSGTVTLDGQPLADARVLFTPTEKKNPGPSSSATTDASGRYTLAAISGQPGAVVGNHRVSITTARGKGSSRDDRGTQAVQEILPACYNADTRLSFDVPPGGTDTADWKLARKGMPQ